MVKMMKDKIYWNVCSYVGACILEISKYHMYSFFYEKLVTHFGNNIQTFMMDTDSLMLSFTDMDPEDFEHANLHLFDTSDYPKNHRNYSDMNKKVAGKVKDEFSAEIVQEFIGLKSKMYSIQLLNKTQKCTAKGVKTSYFLANLKHETYKS